jgi:hypothetical protein
MGAGAHRRPNGGETAASRNRCPEAAGVSLGKAIVAKVGVQSGNIAVNAARQALESLLAGRRAACRSGFMATNLEGIRSRRWPAPSGLKRLMAKSLARQSLVSYQIVETPSHDASVVEKPTEKRSSARRRLRLRSAKLLDSRGAFICECLVRDQSAQGLCLMLMKNIGLPTRCALYDDETGSLNVVMTMWRRGFLLGVRYCLNAPPVSIKPSDRAALRGRYYAVSD